MSKKEKRYYWIKLKIDFFNQDNIDYLMQQENGCKYIVLYEMLCLQTANKNGNMATRIGEVLAPYNVNKIVRDTKYFDTDTVIIALELFKRLGLIFQEDNDVFRITAMDEMVGSECGSASRVRRYRAKIRKKEALQCNNECNDKVLHCNNNALQCNQEIEID